MTVATERSLFARLGARTSPGSWKTNEDTFLASDLDRQITLRPQDLPVSIAAPTSIVVGVYDGLGAYNNGDGERMSQLAAESVHAAMATSVLPRTNLGIALTDALAAANDALREKWSSDRQCYNSYSFATVAAFNATGLWVAHSAQERRRRGQ
jgi:serine/threonine protein phosphatase PrpC